MLPIINHRFRVMASKLHHRSNLDLVIVVVFFVAVWGGEHQSQQARRILAPEVVNYAPNRNAWVQAG